VIADRGESSVITAIMSEDDVRTALKHPLVGVGTDSAAKAEDGRLSESSRIHAPGDRSRAFLDVTSGTSIC
jgi:hypothetical protein